ncbi:alpha/beta hydrolase family protein [Myroides sp. LJL115]
MELIKQSLIIDKTQGKILSDFTYPKGQKNLPLVIFAHGYKGFKDWGAWHIAMDTIAKAGAFVVKFNFSKNGTSIDNPTEFVDLEAFATNTYSLEQEDLKDVINTYKTHALVDSTDISIIGHSRAGGNVVLQGCYNPDVTKVIIWAGVADFKKRFPQRQRFDSWKERGVFYVKNLRTNQELPHYFTYWEDFETNFEALNIQKAAQNLKKPTLIVHGTLDQAVDVKEADLLHLWITSSSLIKIEDADHVFGAKHPYLDKVLSRDLNLVVEKTIDFILDKNPAVESLVIKAD